MIIVNNQTPTSELTSIKIGDQISNGLGTFGEVQNIKFENTDTYWDFVFVLVAGGLIHARKIRNVC